MVVRVFLFLQLFLKFVTLSSVAWAMRLFVYTVRSSFFFSIYIQEPSTSCMLQMILVKSISVSMMPFYVGNENFEYKLSVIEIPFSPLLISRNGKYRPTSMLSIFSKIIGILICNHIWNHTSPNDLITTSRDLGHKNHLNWLKLICWRKLKSHVPFVFFDWN